MFCGRLKGAGFAGGGAKQVINLSRQNIEGVEDADDAENRWVEDADGAVGVAGFDGAAGVNDVGRGAGRDGRCALERETTQAIGQQHTSPLRARCEARRREIVLIFGCGKGLVRYGPGALCFFVPPPHWGGLDLKRG